ncbi:MAG: hypothetical protein KDB35_20175, partial [Acidimicrobiales bacterium]|nr:hypothetical protein [Acidimicrobiales bacterium]
MAAGLVGVVPVLPAVPAVAVGLSPDTTLDVADAAPGDGICGDGTPGSCSLRAAVQEANATAGADSIVLTPGATYTLGIAGANEDDAATGDLDLNDSITITGNGATLDAAFLDRYFDVRAGVATISGVTITAGHAPMTPEVLRPGYGGAVAV